MWLLQTSFSFFGLASKEPAMLGPFRDKPGGVCHHTRCSFSFLTLVSDALQCFNAVDWSFPQECIYYILWNLFWGCRPAARVARVTTGAKSQHHSAILASAFSNIPALDATTEPSKFSSTCSCGTGLTVDNKWSVIQHISSHCSQPLFFAVLCRYTVCCTTTLLDPQALATDVPSGCSRLGSRWGLTKPMNRSLMFRLNRVFGLFR